MGNNKFISVICLVIFTLSITNNVFCRNNDNFVKRIPTDSIVQNLEVDLRLSYGFIAHHRYEMKGYNAHFPLFEFSIQKQTYGKSAWQTYFNYPTIGVTAFYSSLGNIDIIGNAYAIYPFIYFPFNKNKTNTFEFRLGVGLGYLTEKYNHLENSHNTYIGSHFNAAASLTFEYKRQIADRYKISAFAGLTHFSNGCTNTPNHGINIPKAGIGVSYMLSEPHKFVPRQHVDNSQFRKIRPEFYAGISFGIKRIKYQQKNDIAVCNFELYLMDRVSNLSKVGIGIDVVYDATDNIYVKEHYGADFKFTSLELLKPGISAAYELLIGDASFLFNFGYHPYGLDMRYGRWYQKIALKADFGKYLYGKIALTTHWGVADFIGFGLGIRIVKN